MSAHWQQPPYRPAAPRWLSISAFALLALGLVLGIVGFIVVQSQTGLSTYVAPAKGEMQPVADFNFQPPVPTDKYPENVPAAMTGGTIAPPIGDTGPTDYMSEKEVLDELRRSHPGTEIQVQRPEGH